MLAQLIRGLVIHLIAKQSCDTHRSTYTSVAQSTAKAIKMSIHPNADSLKRARLLTAGLSGAADPLGGTWIGRRQDNAVFAAKVRVTIK
jgi:hypothetical protein